MQNLIFLVTKKYLYESINLIYAMSYSNLYLISDCLAWLRCCFTISVHTFFYLLIDSSCLLKVVYKQTTPHYKKIHTLFELGKIIYFCADKT